MPKKKGSKKKGSKKKGKKGGGKATAVTDGTTLNREFYHIQITDLEERLQRLQLKNAEIATEHDELKKSAAAASEATVSETQFLQREVGKRTEELAVQKIDAWRIQKALEAEVADLQKKIAVDATAFAREAERLKEVISIRDRKIASLGEFQKKEEALGTRMRDLEEQLLAKESAHAAELDRLQRKELYDKQTIQQRVLERVEAVSAAFREEAAAKLSDTTKRALGENVALGEELIQVNRDAQAVLSENEKLVRAATANKIELEIASDMHKELIKQKNKNYKVIQRMKEKVVEEEEARAALVAEQDAMRTKHLDDLIEMRRQHELELNAAREIAENARAVSAVFEAKCNANSTENSNKALTEAVAWASDIADECVAAIRRVQAQHDNNIERLNDTCGDRARDICVELEAHHNGNIAELNTLLEMAERARRREDRMPKYAKGILGLVPKDGHNGGLMITTGSIARIPDVCSVGVQTQVNNEDDDVREETDDTIDERLLATGRITFRGSPMRQNARQRPQSASSIHQSSSLKARRPMSAQSIHVNRTGLSTTPRPTWNDSTSTKSTSHRPVSSGGKPSRSRSNSTSNRPISAESTSASLQRSSASIQATLTSTVQLSAHGRSKMAWGNNEVHDRVARSMGVSANV